MAQAEIITWLLSKILRNRLVFRKQMINVLRKMMDLFYSWKSHRLKIPNTILNMKFFESFYSGSYYPVFMNTTLIQ